MRCPQCGAELDFDHSICSECGANLSDEPVSSDQPDATSPLGLGHSVMARWTDMFWYHAVVDGQRGDLRHITFRDGFEMWCDPAEITTTADNASSDVDGQSLDLCQQVEVLCPDGQWRPGMIDALYGRIWHVSFHDGIQSWAAGEIIRADEEDAGVFSRRSGEQGDPPGRGARVLARLPSGLWFPGMIDDEEDELRRVLFFVGKEVWLDGAHVSSLSTARERTDSTGATLAVGARVMGQWTDGQWYPGVADAWFGKLWHVHFDDYDQAWLETDAIRLIEEGATGSGDPKRSERAFVNLDPGPPETSKLVLAAHRRVSRWKIIAVMAFVVGVSVGSCLSGQLGG